jgi:DNA-binding transcriptional MerR regulator/methylmalonyl-CoA mutase cobalamin-binding subunit
LNTTGFNITAAERDTGLSKDLLRMWERRYGFPQPERDQHGERVYPLVQIERLRTIKRLIDRGFRPGKLLPLANQELQALLQSETDSSAPSSDFDSSTFILQLNTGDLSGLRSSLQQLIVRHGLQNFVLDIAVPLTIAVGDAWMQGLIRVHEEHAYTEILQSVLRQALAILPSDRGRPRLLLTTLPDEPHSLGLLMAETLFTLEGAYCISLGTGTPLAEIGHAAAAHAADAVALSFSASFSPRQATQQLAELRKLLSGNVELWIGGAGVARIQVPDNIHLGKGRHGANELLAGWHERHTLKAI